MIYPPGFGPNQLFFKGSGKPGPVPNSTRMQAAAVILSCFTDDLVLAVKHDPVGSKSWFVYEFGTPGLIAWEKIMKL